MKQILILIKEAARKNAGHSSHDFEHTLRVWRNAQRIAGTVKCDMLVVEAAALLHDIARHKEEIGECECHAAEGAKMAKGILKGLGIGEETAEKIAYCIAVHRYSKGIKPRTVEAGILQDADRLDALGAITIARVFAYGGEVKRPIYDLSEKPMKNYIGSKEKHSRNSLNHFYEKILKLKPASFNTREGRKMARLRYEFVRKYVRQLENEIRGKA